jgi:ATP-dependent DNA helicase RecQ
MPVPADATPDLGVGLARFGFAEFRAGQREAIETLLRVGRLLLVAPTGGGKSLVYQLPATLLPGTSLVVSPLIALMYDQVRALEAVGVSATFLASTVEADESRRRFRGIAHGDYDLVYVAPERLTLPSFRSLLQDLDCPLVAVDEAHCISDWGHDFRPEYLQIGELLADLPEARVLACTATATPLVRDEILARLGLPPDTPQVVRGFARPNLRLHVRDGLRAPERRQAVDAMLESALGQPDAASGAAIVYSPTRRLCEVEAVRLEGAGWRAAAYHAGLDGPERDRVQNAFLEGELEVIVATNAFGMGIDRADVRAVIHLAPPGSLEAYYQEVGRAGRDGADAFGLLLMSPEDAPRRRSLIQRDGNSGEIAPDLVAHKWELYLELLRWAEGGSCRHDAILRYFSDEAETLAGCGHCDVCERLDAPEAADPEEVDEVVRKGLSAVARVHRRFGLRAAVQLLRGQRDPRLERSGLDQTPTFGVLDSRSEEWLLRLLQRCVVAGWVSFDGDERPVVVLTASGRAVMRGERPARIVLPPTRMAPPPARVARSSKGSRRAAPARAAEDADWSPAEQALFDALRACRQEIARREGIPAYRAAHDRSLRDIARLRPRTPAELELAWGMGPAKVAKFGPEFLAVVARFQS